jgi:predicted RNA-binding Zn ribbon-like protein
MTPPADRTRVAVFRPGPHLNLDELVAFLNTHDLYVGRDRMADASRAGRWLRAHHLLAHEDSLSEREVGRLRQFREVIRSLVAASRAGWLDEPSLTALQRACTGIRYRIEFGMDGTPELQTVAKEADLVVMGRLLLVLLQARVTSAWSRIKVCRNPSCRRVFFDSSKNRSRSWCAMARCGNQAKARAFRRRQPRPTPGGGSRP